MLLMSHLQISGNVEVLSNQTLKKRKIKDTYIRHIDDVFGGQYLY